MASITIRRLENAVKAKLRMRAVANARSMEEETRQILRSTLGQIPAHPVRNMDRQLSTLPLPKRLIELERQGIWGAAKDPDTRRAGFWSP